MFYYYVLTYLLVVYELLTREEHDEFWFKVIEACEGVL